MTIEKEVTDIIVEQLGVDVADITLEKSFVEDLNADSLDLTELIMTFEERFGFEISEEDMKLRGFGDLLGFKQSGIKNFRLADPIQNEASNGLKNDRGTIAMARTMEPHSATGQFFINHKDNNFLNHTAETSQGWGYAVFGSVIDGMDVVDQIALSTTSTVGGYADAPLEPTVINSVIVSE